MDLSNKRISNDHDSIMKSVTAIAVILMFIITPLSVFGSLEDLEVKYFYEGTSPGAKLGWNITSVGNVGGSADEDYAVSAPGDDRVYIWHGPLPSGFTTATTTGGPNWIISGPSDSDFGWSVAGIPDINNDGKNEILIGAPAESKAYLFKGGSPSTSKSYTSADLTIIGNESDKLGHSVAGIDYANNSNIYIAIGAPLNNHLVESAGGNYTTGAVFMWNMTSVNLSSVDTVYWYAANKSLVGDFNNGMFGFTMVNLGDVNLDGREDLGIGDPYYDWNDDGAFYILYGKNPELELPIIVASAINGFISGETGSRFGWSTTRAGWLGGIDPFAAVVVGAPMYGKGKVYIFYGQRSPLRGNISPLNPTPLSVDHTLEGELDGDRFGWSVCTNSMGDEDLSVTVGAPGYDNGTVMETGGVFTFYMLFGTNVSISDADTSFIGEAEGDNLGTGVCEVAFGSGGDLHILVSAANYDRSFSQVNTGKLYVLARNVLPVLTIGLPSPSIGNENDPFLLTLMYQDDDGDMPEYVYMTVYVDSGMTIPIRTFKLNKTADNDPIVGINYTVVTKLPNSITENDRAANFYLGAETRAIRGSTRTIKTLTSSKGPIVDGILPSSAQFVKARTWEDNDPLAEEGTLQVSWEWPGEDEFPSGNVEGDVNKLTLKYMKDEPITGSNWDDASEYKTFQGSQILGKEVHQNWLTLGVFGDLVNNPNEISFSYEIGSVNMYYFALVAEDDQGNVGPISDSAGAEIWWKKPLIPGNTTCELLDVPDDNGGELSLTWIPSSVIFEDLLSYWIFIDDEPFSSIQNDDGSYHVPDFNITKDDDQFYNTTDKYIISSFHGGDLKDGNKYYAAVVPINWLGQFTPLVEMSGPETVINDIEMAITPIKDLRAQDTPDDYGTSLTIEWTPTQDPRFTEYLIYGADFPFSDVEQAVLINRLTDSKASSYKIEELSGADISPGRLYSFAVVIRDYNRHMNTDLEVDGNYVANIRAINDKDVTPEDQVDHVEMVDIPNDGGGALLVSWAGNIVPGEFWRYYIYFSDEPIESVLDVEPYTNISNYRTSSYEINQTPDGEAVVDGKDYYVVVTIEDFNNNENTDIIQDWPGNNYAGPVQPVNQSDLTPPPAVQGLRVPGPEDVNNTWVRITWTAVNLDNVRDFNRYILTYWEQIEYPEEIIIEDIEMNSWTIDGLTRGTIYWLNISIVDDNGNRGDAFDPINVTTTGLNQAPYNLSITIKHERGDAEELFQIVLNEKEPSTVIKIEDIAGTRQLYFVGLANDDYTLRPERMEYYWNLTTPDGDFIEKSGKVPSFNIPIEKEGTYTISLIMEDDEGERSQELLVTIEITKKKSSETKLGPILLAVFIVLLILFILIGLFIWISGKRSVAKEQMEKYEERKKEIEAMESIYTNLPTWSCSCGQTKVSITDDSHCSFCLESFEGVPIDSIDKYLSDHDLVLTEMRIAIPIGWQGQDQAIANAEDDLEERKKRALDDLGQEYAGVLHHGEQPGDEEEGEEEPLESLMHRGAIIPGQAPPPSTVSPQMPPPPTAGPPQMGGGQPTPIVPPGAQPPGRIVPPGQPMRPGAPGRIVPPGQPMRPGAPGPIVPPKPGQPRPPFPPQQQ